MSFFLNQPCRLVDILDWNSLDESFKSIIKEGYHKIL